MRCCNEDRLLRKQQYPRPEMSLNASLSVFKYMKRYRNTFSIPPRLSLLLKHYFRTVGVIFNSNFFLSRSTVIFVSLPALMAPRTAV